MCVDWKYRSAERIHHHAPRRLFPNTRKRSQEFLACARPCNAKWCQCDASVFRAKQSRNTRDYVRLLPVQPAAPKGRCYVIWLRICQVVEPRIYPFQHRECARVQFLVGLEAAEDEEQFLKWVPAVAVGVIVIARGQRSGDFRYESWGMVCHWLDLSLPSRESLRPLRRSLAPSRRERRCRSS